MAVPISRLTAHLRWVSAIRIPANGHQVKPHEILNDIAQDEWADPVTTASKAARALLGLTGQSWAEDGVVAAQALRKRRPDQPLLLAVTEVSMDLNAARTAAALEAIIARLEDLRWSMDLAYEAARYPRLGVLSLGASTRTVLRGVTEAASPELLTSSRAIRRGLLEFITPVTLVPAETADCLLLPVIARHIGRMWTTGPFARTAHAAMANGKAVLPIIHPLAELSPLSRQAFRPAPYVTDITFEIQDPSS